MDDTGSCDHGSRAALLDTFNVPDLAIHSFPEPANILCALDEWFCAIKNWMSSAREFNLPPPVNRTCPEYTLHQLTQVRIGVTQKQCEGKNEQQINTLGPGQRLRCHNYQKLQKQGYVNPDPTPYCDSIKAFLDSKEFNHFQDMFKECTHPKKESDTEEYWMDGALEYLGGLDTAVGEDDMVG